MKLCSPVLLALLLSAGLVPAHAEEPKPIAEEPKPIYDGAAQLYNLPELAVVYPAAEGDRAARNRFVATQIANYLRDTRGIEVTLSTDREASDAVRRGNLLVLGRDNTLLAAPGKAALFEPVPGGQVFAGSIFVGATRIYVMLR